MGEAIYHVLVIAVALVGLFRGFQAGLMRQVSGLLGFVFGIVAARAVGPDFSAWLAGWFPQVYHPVARVFFISVLGHGIVWGLCMFAFSMFAGILNFILSVRGFHPLRRHFPVASANFRPSIYRRSYNPGQRRNAAGLGSCAFARHYLRNHFCFLFLRVLRCFSSPG